MGTNQDLIFIVEDDPAFNKLISSFISSKNVGTIKSFHSGEECLEQVHQLPGIIFLDFDLPHKNGLETMKEIKKISPESKIIFLSGQSNVKTGIEIMKEGATDYIVKDMHAKENVLYKIIDLQKTDSDKNNNPDFKQDKPFFY